MFLMGAIPLCCNNILLPSKTQHINQQLDHIILHSWQHVSTVNSHHQDKTEQTLFYFGLMTAVYSRNMLPSLFYFGMMMAVNNRNMLPSLFYFRLMMAVYSRNLLPRR